MRIAFLKYRLQAPGFEGPQTVCPRQQEYDEVSARALEQIADRIEPGQPASAIGAGELRELMERRLHDVEVAASRELPATRANHLPRCSTR